MTASKLEYQKVAVVGASGFVGVYLTNLLFKDGFLVSPMVRKVVSASSSPLVIEIGDVLSRKNYDGIFEGITTIVYTIARTHQTNEENADFEHIYKEINCDAMIRLAEASRAQGVKRFIFLSSLKALGEETSRDEPLRYNSTPQPEGPYGRSKLIAENMLLELGRSTGLEVVIIRPPLIHGQGVKGNLDTLLRMIKLGLPLPFSRMSVNRRSLVSLENLCALIKECVINPAAKNQVFMVKDQENLSTVGIIRLLSKSSGVTPVLFPVPRFVLRWSFILIGKRGMLQRLLGDLTIDDEYTRSTLNWRPVCRSEKSQ
jgi:UDP-glucose 4-epimerase